MQRIRELDGLRAIAIVGVLISHFVHEDTQLANLLRLGWAGVDLFFAISGFLITEILIDLRGKEGSFRTFYGRRTLRIFPPYYAAMILTLALAVLHGEQVNYRALLHHAFFLSSAKPTLVKTAVMRIFSGARTAPPVPLTPALALPGFNDAFGVYWSLSVEELFYLVWAPVLLKGSRRLVMLFSTVPLLLCPLLRGLAHTTPHIEENLGFVFRFDSLAAGACVALLLSGIDRGRFAPKTIDRGLVATFVLSLLGLVTVAKRCGALHGDVHKTLLFSVLGSSLLAVMCASIVGACARWSGRLGFCSTLLRSAPATYVGKVSYTMYLIHMPVYILIGLLLIRLFGTDPFTAGVGVAVLCGVLATTGLIGVAGLSWKYYEAPILRAKDLLFPMGTLGVSATVAKVDPDRVFA